MSVDYFGKDNHSLNAGKTYSGIWMQKIPFNTKIGKDVVIFVKLYPGAGSGMLIKCVNIVESVQHSLISFPVYFNVF